MTAKAVAILDAGKPRAYENAIAALRADTREWWEDVLSRDPEDFDEVETPFTPDADGLRRFIERDLRPWYVQRRKELQNRPLIRALAFGQSLDPDKLSRLARYEVHLDRKLERTLAMLLRLQDLRRGDGRIMIRFAKCPGSSSRKIPCGRARRGGSPSISPDFSGNSPGNPKSRRLHSRHLNGNFGEVVIMPPTGLKVPRPVAGQSERRRPEVPADSRACGECV